MNIFSQKPWRGSNTSRLKLNEISGFSFPPELVASPGEGVPKVATCISVSALPVVFRYKA